MKTKLLRKVRKNFEITRIDSLGEINSFTKQILSECFTYPFYCVREDGFQTYEEYFQTYEETYKDLCELIHKRYKTKKHKKSCVEVKVWYNGQIK